MPTKTVYALFDARYPTDPDRASCYTVSDTLKEAREDKRTMFPDGTIVKETLRQNAGKQWEAIESVVIS